MASEFVSHRQNLTRFATSSSTRTVPKDPLKFSRSGKLLTEGVELPSVTVLRYRYEG